MKNQTQIALAVGAGYLLGRRRRMRFALALGTAAATGRLGGLTGQMLRRGAKVLGPEGPISSVSPEFGEITGMVRGELLDAGKAAALTAVRGRLDQMSDKLHEQAEALRQSHDGDQQARPTGQGAEDEGADYEDTGGEAGDYEDTGGEAGDYEDTEDWAGPSQDEDTEGYEDTGEYEETSDQAAGYEDTGATGDADAGGSADAEGRAGPREPARGMEDRVAGADEPREGPDMNGEVHRRRPAPPVRRTGR